VMPVVSGRCLRKSRRRRGGLLQKAAIGLSSIR
jgi:hypothetical protein